MGYSREDEVYEATGLNASIVKSLGEFNTLAEVTVLVERYISKADKKIKRLLKVPITVRKEYHLFDYNKTVELGPHEDTFEFYSNDDPTDCVEAVYAVYGRNGRIKLPYPKDCDNRTEDVDDMTATNVVLTKETTTIKCGDASVKAVFQAGGSFYFPSNANLNKNIEPWQYIGFWFQTSDATATFTMKLYDKDGNSMSQTFTLDLNDTWEIVSLNMDNFTGSINWGTTNLQKIEITSDKACTAYFDNFNFNDLLFWTYPEGLICWSDPDSTPYSEIAVTYSYDPYKINVPEDLADASAKLAGILLLDFCIGARLRITGFKQMSHDLDAEMPDKSTLEVVRGRLKREAMDALAGLGFGTFEGIGVA